MPDFIFKLLKYFMPCTELSYRYSCNNLWKISFLLFITGWLSIGYSTNSSFAFFEISTWLTVIFFSLYRLCCKVFDNMMQKNSRFSQYFLDIHCLQNILHKTIHLIMLLLRYVALYYCLIRITLILSLHRKLCCYDQTCKRSVSRLILNNLLYFVKLMKHDGKSDNQKNAVL